MLGAIPSHHPKYRTKLCRNFVNGNCSFGQKCSFFHPALRLSPSSCSIASDAFNWNALLLPQLLALSNQKVTQKPMPRRSPPWFQGSQLIDEDPSPSTSLLLSTSDCTSSDQVPQTKRSSRRKKYPCRHFIRTGGWCPAAGHCKFQHNVAALPSAGIRKVDCAPPRATDTHGEGGRTISGGVLMGIQSSSPLIVSRTHSEPQYTEAGLMPPSSSTRYPHMNASNVLNDHSDQPVYWPNHTWQPHLPYYAAVPAMSISATAGLCSAVARQGVYPPSQPPAQTVPPRETQTSLPMGSYEMNGTTYFPSSMPCVPAPPPPTSSSMPVYPIPFNHTMTPVYPYYAPPALHAGHYDIHNRTTDVGSQASFDPFASDRMMPSELPVIPRLEDYQMSPVQQDVLVPPLSLPPMSSGDQDLTTTGDKLTATQEHEFPYRPLKDQRVGHARRISVNIKKHVRVNSG